MKHEAGIDSMSSKINKASQEDTDSVLSVIIEKIRADIPEKKRISYGRYSVVKDVGPYLYPVPAKGVADVSSYGFAIYLDTEIDSLIRKLITNDSRN